MQLLTEEFLKKTFNYINQINIFMIRWVIKFIFYLILAGIIAYIIVSAIQKNYLPVIIILGLLLLGELAHYLRKTREKVMNEKATEENSITKNPKNKTLLKNSKTKNKTLIKNKPKKILLKKQKILRKKTLIKKHSLKKIDSSLINPKKAKNKTLLKVSKPKKRLRSFSRKMP